MDVDPPSTGSPASSIDSNLSTTVDGRDLREALDECFTGIESDGSFALSEELKNPPNPGIYLKKGGLIGLPLNDHDAGLIVAASHAAPFGKGQKTIVDTKVRKTWELSKADFEIRNPAWAEFLQSVVKKVSAGLGVDSAGKGVVASLYKMLLYDKGAMFKPHQDSEKVPNMFATLVIALPSFHNGGQVRVTHAGITKTFETSKFSAFDSSYLAWFADVTHEVKPVLSGRRLVLTYNLIHTTFDAKSLVASSSRTMAKLEQILNGWTEGLDQDRNLPPVLGCMLQHQYTPASLRFDSLKGHDHQVVAHLREACEKTGFSLYLANLERSIFGGCEEVYPGDHWHDPSGFHEIIDEIERDVYLQKIVDLSGKEIGKDISWDEHLLVPRHAFENKIPDDEDYSGFTGNEGVSTTHFYHSTVALLVPRKRRMDFLLRNHHRSYLADAEKSKVLPWIERLTSQLSTEPNIEEVKEDLARICRVVILQAKLKRGEIVRYPSYMRTHHRPVEDQEYAAVLNLILDLDDKVLFTDACHCFISIAPPVFRAIGIGLIRFNLAKSILPILDEHLKLYHSPDTMADVLNLFNELRSGVKYQMEKSGGNDREVQKWLTAHTNRALSSIQEAKVTLNDGIALVQLSNKMKKQEIFAKILPVVKKKMSHPGMVIAFLTGLFDPSLEGKIPQDVVKTVFRDVISDLSTSFQVSQLSNSKPEALRARFLPFSEPISRDPITDARNSENFATLLCLCQKLGFSSEFRTLTRTLVNESKVNDIEFFEDFYLPLLKALKKRTQEREISIKDSSFEDLFQLVLSNYVERYIQAEPKPPSDWVQPTLSCTCVTCQQVNQFLSSPTERVGRFPWSTGRQIHVTDGLRRMGSSHEIERRGSPHTLVVTKTRREYQASQKSWARRRIVAKKHLEDIENDDIKAILGDFHEPIMAMNIEKLTQLGTKKHDEGQRSIGSEEVKGDANHVSPPASKRRKRKN